MARASEQPPSALVSGPAPSGRGRFVVAPGQAARARDGAPPRPVLRLGLAWPRGADSLLLVVVLALAVVLLDLLAQSFSVDSWLDLAAGRQVWQSGLPHYDTLTSMAYGVRWVDQQWLSQLVTYLLDRVGGLGLVGLVDVAMITFGVGIAIVGARRLGARPLSVIALLLLCLLQIIPSHEVRTQAYALPLAAATIVLLAADSRRPSRRVYWCLPILILWANLHGTAILGAALVGLRGMTLAWERRRRLARDLSAWGAPALLGLGGPACLLLTPYGTEMISYYRATTGSAALRHLVTEWQPVTALPFLAVPFFILAAILLWSFGREPRRTSMWDKLATLLLAGITIGVLRNALLFGLCALVVGPVSIDPIVGRRRSRASPERTRLNAILCGVAVTALMVAGTATLVRSQAGLEFSYQRARILQVVRSETADDAGVRVFADERFADWLLWRDPGLAGRIAFDARFELLSPAQMENLVALFSAVGRDWKQAARGDRLVVLDRAASPDAVSGFLAEPGARVLYDDGARIVILRGAREAAHL